MKTMSDQTTAEYTIDGIVGQLDRFHQRATYGAVAALMNRSPRNLMGKRSRAPRDSWIVSHSTGMPTGYEPDQLHPDIASRETILSTREELEAWLANPE
jgi:hypothetical protein